MNDGWILGTGLALVFLASLMGVNAYLHERQRWNGGLCSECGQPWLYFTTDSQGGLGFKCACGRCCWVSYRSVLRASR